MSLADAAWSLLEGAIAHYGDNPRADGFLRAQLTRLDGPLRLAVVGPPRSGRTTLLAAVLGDHVDTDRVVVDWPGAVELVDGGGPDADALLVLAPSPASAEARPPQDHPIARATPVSALRVLSRADEFGGGRVDAMVSARQAARRYAREPDTSYVDTIAVDGLLGLAASTMTVGEANLLERLGALPKQAIDPHLLSTDRFTGETFPDTTPPTPRADLVSRFGLFGVRLATTLARRGVRAGALAEELVRTSGIGELRAAIGTAFVDRSDALRARTALIALDIVLRREPRPSTAPLAADLERVLAGAHDLRELRLLADLRAKRVDLGDTTDEAIHLLGGAGTHPATRLTLSGDPYQALLRWRTHAESPYTESPERQAAAVVTRSLEQIVAAA